MSKIRIAIQGELGAYSHIAAESLYPGAAIKTCITFEETFKQAYNCLLYTSPSPRDRTRSRMPSSA